MDSKDAKRKARSLSQPALERMEARELLTGGVGNTFALMPGTIAQAGQPAEVRFTISPEHFTRPNGKIVVGVDVTPQKDSKVEPRIVSVGNASEVQTAASGPRAHATALRNGIQVSRTPASSAVLATLGGSRRAAQPGKQEFSVKIGGNNNSTGGLVVGFFLPGDADGNGIVNQTDTNIVRKLLGTSVRSSNYAFDADANRDGVINSLDLSLTRINRGAKTTISPVLTANMDPASDTGQQDRVTTISNVKFTGVASPGARIQYREVAGRTPEFTTVADASGTYSIQTQLSTGVNTFRVTSTDGFGQVISGQISPVIVQAS